MRLSDIMSALHLSTYAEVALVLFLVAFAAITLHVFRRQNAGEWELARHLPLDATDDAHPSPPAGAATSPKTIHSS
jgi:cbb3-type cytochrome oxidase subunit 3